MSRILRCGYARNPQAWLMASAFMRGLVILNSADRTSSFPRKRESSLATSETINSWGPASRRREARASLWRSAVAGVTE